MSRGLTDEPAAANVAGRAKVIQPFGWLIGFSSDWRMGCASANIDAVFGEPAADLLGRPLADLLIPSAVHAIRNRFALLRAGEGVERMFGQILIEGQGAFDLVLHLDDSWSILEVVASSRQTSMDAASMVARMAQRCSEIADLESLASTATRELRALTGFDSVMLMHCRGGEVEPLATSARSGSPDFGALGTLTERNARLCWIKDVESEPVALLSSGTLAAAEPRYLLCGESEVEQELRRAGVRSALLAPIRYGEAALKGSVIALHRTPKAPDLSRLAAVELFTTFLALKIENLELRG